MKIGIIIAISRELKSFLESDFKIETVTSPLGEVYKTKINGNDVFAVKSGWGTIDAAAATQFLITAFGCETILNYGVTGALRKELKVNDLFVVEKACCHDFDVSTIDNVKPCQFEEFPDIYIPLDKGLIDKAKTLLPSLKTAVVASGNKFVEKMEEKDYFREKLKADVCDMEIAAIARVCYKNNVKALSIKSISDELFGNGQDFAANCERSAAAAFGFFKLFLTSI